MWGQVSDLDPKVVTSHNSSSGGSNVTTEVVVVVFFVEKAKTLYHRTLTSVSFKNDRLVRRVYVAEHINAIVNRLNKTRVERVVDHEAEKIEREQTEAKERRLESNERRNRELELSRLRKAESESRDYSRLHETKAALSYEEEEAEWNSRQKDGEFDPDEDFM
ncbi:hypothetical protein MVLG_03229 [Microbotryum lychnidis-dioicae p1A1 Lamole]|uniref:Uncharacterized protein n=1 Tax=Microbotryum lychnidis-dioicae (strain p1A1 Lamole / MvSl-1064) TaxID=683840 RepID=U5H7K3_USTV1|nr:hypothetical protein MVLG_03229 [Microbotryum lychnidis-dioicae p1A1 Lamole]|eukprot:KDE06444.1 hypothetical protein MVLG_03229 [Microbotryum lychnidis-dioicae p1A1 Lamole]